MFTEGTIWILTHGQVAFIPTYQQGLGTLQHRSDLQDLRYAPLLRLGIDAHPIEKDHLAAAPEKKRPYRLWAMELPNSQVLA